MIPWILPGVKSWPQLLLKTQNQNTKKSPTSRSVCDSNGCWMLSQPPIPVKPSPLRATRVSLKQAEKPVPSGSWAFDYQQMQGSSSSPSQYQNSFWLWATPMAFTLKLPMQPPALEKIWGLQGCRIRLRFSALGQKLWRPERASLEVQSYERG